MKRLPTLARARWRSPASPRSLAGCKTTRTGRRHGEHPERLPPAPPDRGAREGEQTLTVFIGDAPRRTDADAARRGRRARLELAAARRPAASSSKCRPARRTSAPPTSASREIRSILGAAGVPRHAIEIRPYPTAGSGPARHHPRQLSEDGGGDRPVRAVAGRPRPDLRRRLHAANQPALESRLRHPAQSRRAGRRIRPTSCSRAPKRPCSPRAAPPSLDKYRKGEADRDAIPGCQQRQDQRRGPMIKFALKGGDRSAAPAEAAVQEEHIAPVPRISIQAFCASRRHRRRHAGGGRRPAHGQGASEGADGRHRGGDRGLSRLARRRMSSSSSRTAAARNCSPASIRSPRCATPARA